jgi:PAS domain S-box-containing protein
MRTLKILQLEDSLVDSELLVATLGPVYDLHLIRVDSENEFKSALDDPTLDLIISDFTLPSYSGASALALARTLRPDLPFIFFSGTLGEEAAIDALRAGATDYILKNRPQKMLAAIERALRETDERRKLRAAELDLERNRERFRTLIENALDVISVIDLQANFTFNSPSIQKVLGYTPDELAGVNAFSLLHLDDQISAQQAFNTALRQPNVSISTEVRARHKDGSWRILELRGQALLPGGSIDGVVINSRDVTDKRETEAQLLRAQRMECLGILAGGIAHDLNNILSPVLMGSELLKSYCQDPEALGIIETIQASSQRGSDLVKHILSFARGVKGEAGRLNVKPLIQEIVKLLRDTLPKNIQFQTHLAQDLRPVVCNPTELHQVIMNLCVNARDAMPEGGLLQIKAANYELSPEARAAHPDPALHYVRISIADSGTGIPPEILPKIFKPFFTTKEEGKGTGLGLSTVLSIIKRNEGLIDVENIPGEGVTFHITFPAVDSEEDPAVRRSSSPPSGKGQHILVVDDESAILEITKVILENANYNVTVASDGVQALRIFLASPQQWKLVITDASMPIMDGPTLARELHRLVPDLPVLCATGDAANLMVLNDSDRGVDAVISKPYSSRELLFTVSSLLSAKAQSQSSRPQQASPHPAKT